jgi:CRP-like cAMP-binding protein
MTPVEMAAGGSPLEDALAVLSSPSCPFSLVTVDLRQRLLAVMQAREYQAGEHLIRQDDAGDFLLLIVSGTATAFVRHARGDHTPIGQFGRCDVVGEISPLTGEARTADVVAQTPVRALLLSTGDFHMMANRHPEIRILLTNLVADRLGKATYDGLGGKDIHGYRIDRCVGRGGMGVVYEATRLDSDETVAVKMLNHRLLYDPGAIQRFQREAEVLQSLRHESIARLHGTFAAYGTHFLVMEFCAGDTLKVLFDRAVPWDEASVRRLVGQLAAALRDVHKHGLIHRDLKPSNVMVTPSGVVKLLDFGLVKVDPTWPSGESSEGQTVSRSLVFHGTPRYMAPEQFGHGPLDSRVDIYGLACVGYEALSGRPVVNATDLLEVIQQKLQFELPVAEHIGRGVSAEMRQFLERGLEHQPGRRTVDLDQLATWAGPVVVDASASNSRTLRLGRR